MSKKSVALPLESIVEVTQSDSYRPQLFAYLSRGLMTDYDVTNTEGPPLSGPYSGHPKASLMTLQGALRAQLDAAELPTDQWPVMPIGLDTTYSPEEHGIRRDEDLWYDAAKESTEPLTKNRVAVELLHAVNGLLVSLSDEQLGVVFRAMRFYHLNRMVDGLHDAALQGTTAQKARAKGPKAKQERSKKLRELIRSCAEEVWSKDAGLKGEYYNTAKKIFDVVNKAKSDQGVGSKPLSVKTIADHLRAAFSVPETLSDAPGV